MNISLTGDREGGGGRRGSDTKMDEGEGGRRDERGGRRKKGRVRREEGERGEELI